MLRDICLIARPPLLAVMQGGEYRSTATQALRLVEKFCNTLTRRGISARDLTLGSTRGAVILEPLVHQSDDFIERFGLECLLLCNPPDETIHALDVISASKKRSSRR